LVISIEYYDARNNEYKIQDENFLSDCLTLEDVPNNLSLNVSYKLSIYAA